MTESFNKHNKEIEPNLNKQRKSLPNIDLYDFILFSIPVYIVLSLLLLNFILSVPLSISMSIGSTISVISIFYVLFIKPPNKNTCVN